MKIYKDIFQQSPEWLELRKGKVTGSTKAISLYKNKEELKDTQTLYQLLAEKYTNEADLNKYEILERGHMLEPDIINRFKEETGKEVEQVGFIEKDEYIGLSPDGIISINGVYKEAIECKAPMGANYIKYLLEDQIPSEYKQQILQYFIVIEELETLYFCIYHDRVEGIKDFKIFTINRKDLQEEIEERKKTLDLFIKKVKETEKLLLNK